MLPLYRVRSMDCSDLRHGLGRFTLPCRITPPVTPQLLLRTSAQEHGVWRAQANILRTWSVLNNTHVFFAFLTPKL